MSHIPAELSYAQTHEWVRIENDGTLTIGITDHAQGALGDIVFVELPSPGKVFAAGENCAVIESVKTASDIHAPVAGEVIAVNQAVSDTPEAVNEDAYAAWLFRLKPASVELSGLLDADGYRQSIA